MMSGAASDRQHELVILDRDGVINADSKDFIKSVDEWQPIDGSLRAIAKLCAAGFTVAVATNQSGVARQLFSEQTLHEIHKKMCDAVSDAGGRIDRIEYCPHHPDDECHCRKPKTGLLDAIADHYKLSLSGTPIIGDSLRDLAAAKNAGARPILVLTGNGKKTLAEVGDDCEHFDDLASAADQLIGERDA